MGACLLGDGLRVRILAYKEYVQFAYKKSIVPDSTLLRILCTCQVPLPFVLLGTCLPGTGLLVLTLL